MNYYDVLSIAKDATADQISAAYRKQALKYHPDISSDPESTEKFKQATEAYEVLSDHQKKAEYDRGPVNFGININPEVFAGFAGVVQNSIWQQHGRDRGRDARAVVDLTFEESILGCKKEVKISIQEKCKCDRGYSTWDTCSNCQGSGKVVINIHPWKLESGCASCAGGGKIPKDKCNECNGQGFLSPKDEVISVDVPAGVEGGMQIKLPGKGQLGITGQRGTLYVHISVKPHPLFIRKGSDIYSTIPVTYTQLILGDNIDVLTVNGNSSLKIPPGTSTNRKLRLKGQGAPDLSSGRNGDMYVVLDLDVPIKLEEDYKSVIEQLKSLENKYISDRMKKFKEV